MRNLLSLFASLMLLLSASSASAKTKVAIVVDGPWERNDTVVGLFQTEMMDLLGREFDLTFTDADVRRGDWTLEGIRGALDEAFSDPTVDAVIGLGPVASHELCLRASIPKPAVAPFVIDPEVQGVPLANGTSGARNLSYIASVSTLRRDLEVFREIIPFDRIAFLTTNSLVQAIPAIGERIQEAAVSVGAEAIVLPVGESAGEALAAIPSDVDAVYIAPLLRLSEVEFNALLAGLIERRLPSFSLLGRVEVDLGVLVGLAPREEFARVARRTALNLQRMLLGEDGGTLPVAFTDTERLSFNVSTARALGVRPSWKTLTEADVVDTERKKVDRTYSLKDAVQHALAVNLDLRAAEKSVDRIGEDSKVARAALLPQLNAAVTGVQIDRDQAAAALGRAAERSLSSRVSLQQLLYSDDALTNFTGSKHAAASQERERDAIRLDIIQAASTAYFDVLRAKTLEQIQQDNLRRSQANLELARSRESIGASGPGEVYRWQGEIATQRRDVIDANALRNVAEISFNRLLNRPLEESFRISAVNLQDPDLGISDPRLQRYLADPWSFRVFREFLAIYAVESSPEVMQLDEAIAAQARVVNNTNRTFFLPTVGLEGDLNHTWTRDGVGSDPASDGLPVPEDTDWSVGLSASLPLFEGGARIAQRRGARDRIDELERQREAAAERIEQRARTALHLAGASLAGIELSNEAATAARNNLELVLDGYSKGAVSILDLLDAQNSALNAEQGAANAVYDFLIDLMEVERAAGFPSCVDHPSEFEAFVSRLEAFRAQGEAK